MRPYSQQFVWVVHRSTPPTASSWHSLHAVQQFTQSRCGQRTGKVFGELCSPLNSLINNYQILAKFTAAAVHREDKGETRQTLTSTEDGGGIFCLHWSPCCWLTALSFRAQGLSHWTTWSLPGSVAKVTSVLNYLLRRTESGSFWNKGLRKTIFLSLIEFRTEECRGQDEGWWTLGQCCAG